MNRRIWILACVLALPALTCASPADLERKKLGSGRCAKLADDKCEDSMPNADRLGCLKRETFLCEQMEEAEKGQAP